MRRWPVDARWVPIPANPGGHSAESGHLLVGGRVSDRRKGRYPLMITSLSLVSG